MLLQSEIAEEYPVDNKFIRTPYGWKRILRVYKTISMPVWELHTQHHFLQASSHHLVRTGDGCHPINSLRTGDSVLTESGWEVVVSVKDTGRKEALYDITVDDPSGLFYSDGIVSHNSTTFAARQMVMSHLIPGYKSIYVVPAASQLDTYAHRYEEMETYFRVPVGTQLKLRKVYKNGSTVEMVYCGENSQKIRGKTSFEVLLDEIQGLDPNLLDDILYTTTTSRMSTTIYAGTSMSTETLLEAKWQESSQGMWHVRAGDGKHWLNMRDADTLFAVCSKPQGPTCPYTGKLLDITDGSFVHMYKNKLESGQIGFHIPQVIIPDIAYDPVLWGKLHNNVMRNDSTKTLQEAFGIAVSSGAREITERDLMRLCVLRDSEEELKAKCRKGYYSMIVSGCDWGGSDYNPQTKTKTSYTVHCVLGLAPDGAVDILHYRRYSGMNYDEIIKSIMKDHADWSGKAIASDFGVGMAYNMEIRKYVPFDKHFVVSYVGPKTAPVATPQNAHMANQLSVNRTEAITTVFKDAKTVAPPKIRCRSWEIMGDYLKDWLNLYRAPVQGGNSADTFKYIRNATKPDDALHAFCFAYVIMRIFKGDPLVKDPSLESRIRQVMHGTSLKAHNDAVVQELYGTPQVFYEL